MKKIYRHILSKTEALRHYVLITKRWRDMFPPWDEGFNIIVKGRKLKTKVKVDRQNRIWAAIFWDKLPHFDEGDTIIFSKGSDGLFNVDIE